jgi:hypothetical protein
MKANKKFTDLNEWTFQKTYLKLLRVRLDSLFVDNCLAAAGADLFLKNKIPNEKITYIFDNEPRNKEISKTNV